MKSADLLFSNLSVQSKLAIGFFLVITVGLTCMASGFYGAISLSGLIAETKWAGQLKSVITDLRRAQSHICCSGISRRCEQGTARNHSSMSN